MMVMPTRSVMAIMIGGMAFGRMIFVMIRQFRSPMAREAVTYSCSLIFRNSARVSRASVVNYLAEARARGWVRVSLDSDVFAGNRLAETVVGTFRLGPIFGPLSWGRRLSFDPALPTNNTYDNGAAIKLTVARYYLPNGSNFTRKRVEGKDNVVARRVPCGFDGLHDEIECFRS